MFYESTLTHSRFAEVPLRIFYPMIGWSTACFCTTFELIRASITSAVQFTLPYVLTVLSNGKTWIR